MERKTILAKVRKAEKYIQEAKEYERIYRQTDSRKNQQLRNRRMPILTHEVLEVLKVLEVLATHVGVASQLIIFLTLFGRSSLSQLVTQARSTQSRRVVVSGCSLSRQRTKPTPSLIFY